MSEFQDWCNKPEVVLTGNGWGVRISGCDVFDPINQHGVKSFRAFDVVKGLATKEEAESFLANWLKEQLPGFDALSAENERLRKDRDDCLAAREHYAGLYGEALGRLAELERDAARYRWLREASHFDTPQHKAFCKAYGHALDEEIDAALAQPAKESTPALSTNIIRRSFRMPGLG